MNAITNRYEFVYLFDVTNGNPNGDPDAGNLPRLDPETSQGLVTDVCLKRKVRDFIHVLSEPNCEIFIQQKRPLNPLIAEACERNGQEAFAKKGGGWENQKAKNRSQADIAVLQDWLCKKYYDIRSFGAVMSTGPNAGQIRGPVQLAFAKSLEPILPLEQSITRVTDVDKEEGEMGRKHVVPYGLYRAHGFINAKLAEKTGFSQKDLDFLWAALENMFELDRSAARGEMAARKLIVFKHDNPLGSAPAHKLFDCVEVKRVFQGDEYDLPLREGTNIPPARRFEDYRVILHKDCIPKGVEVEERL
jgi:CRISPR-associated protein Csd2